MQPWSDFISSQTVSDDILPDCCMVGLTDLGVIAITGDDAVNFLQGQLTNDVTKVSPEMSQLNSYCSPKGRMLSSFRLFQNDDTLYMVIPRALLDATMKRLQMFVLRSAVTLSDVSTTLGCMAMAGDCAAALLPATPATADASATIDGVTVIRVRGDRPRFLVFAENERLQQLWMAAASRATPAGRDTWSLLDIRGGIPTVHESTVEAFVPQMTNMQLINGVSFTKGCYTGQEVVARMHYLGKLKRRMYHVHFDTDQRPAPGSELHSASSDSGQGAGKVVEAAPSPDGGFEALVVAQIASVAADDLTLGDAGGPGLRLLDLPYDFES